MGRLPTRDRTVYFVGAGLSSAFDLPNTPQLLSLAIDKALDNAYWKNQKLKERLQEAFSYFYPIEAADDGFLPSVVDFFTVLKSYSQIAQGLPGQLEGVPELLRDLRRVLAHVLVDALRAADRQLRSAHPFLGEILKPEVVVISTNWDLLLERYAEMHRHATRLRLGKDGAAESTLLKLHGSLDWCKREDQTRSRSAAGDYRRLGDQLFGTYSKTRKVGTDDSIVRIGALEQWSSAWSLIKSRAKAPLMLTMAFGKSDELGPLRPIWRDAYLALSRAKRLMIVGYSLPPDDLEIRTLLVSGLRRKTRGQCEVIVQNPSPEVHDRFRNLIRRNIRSNYRPVSAGG